jgi:DNA-binding XRE family transcriptional regulator
MELTLKAARINAGYTQKEVGDSVGKSKNTIASYEAYETQPDIVTAQKMAALYGVSVDNIKWK